MWGLNGFIILCCVVQFSVFSFFEPRNNVQFPVLSIFQAVVLLQLVKQSYNGYSVGLRYDDLLFDWVIVSIQRALFLLSLCFVNCFLVVLCVFLSFAKRWHILLSVYGLSTMFFVPYFVFRAYRFYCLRYCYCVFVFWLMPCLPNILIYRLTNRNLLYASILHISIGFWSMSTRGIKHGINMLICGIKLIFGVFK